MVDAAHEKETRARETIQSLKLEIANLSKLVEQGAGLTMGQEHRYLILESLILENNHVIGHKYMKTTHAYIGLHTCKTL